MIAISCSLFIKKSIFLHVLCHFIFRKKILGIFYCYHLHIQCIGSITIIYLFSMMFHITYVKLLSWLEYSIFGDGFYSFFQSLATWQGTLSKFCQDSNSGDNSRTELWNKIQKSYLQSSTPEKSFLPYVVCTHWRQPKLGNRRVIKKGKLV